MRGLEAKPSLAGGQRSAGDSPASGRGERPMIMAAATASSSLFRARGQRLSPEVTRYGAP